MKETIFVNTGEVKVSGDHKVVLKSNGIGSCIAVVAYEPSRRVGAIAHAMLPGRAPKPEAKDKTKYAADAIDKIIEEMALLGVSGKNLDVCLAGGGNVLEREDDTICTDNLKSIVGLLQEKNITVRRESVGGTKRRSVSLVIETGEVFYSEGDEKEKPWK